MSGANITANTIPSSAINGGLSVSLPTTGTVPTPTSSQIGYTQTGSISSAIVSASYVIPHDANNYLSSIILNGPVGSVWIVSLNCFITFPSGGTIGISCQLNNFQIAVHSYSSAAIQAISATGVYIIQSGTNGAQVDVTARPYGTNGTLTSTNFRFTATRLA